MSLLAVGNPAYPKKSRMGSEAKLPALQLATLFGQLPELPGSKKELEQVRNYFEDPLDPAKAIVLEQTHATKKELLQALPGRNVVLLTMHGFADDRLGNLFGGLALTPPLPGQASNEEDGFLSLHEIYRLSLQDCELAVLRPV